MVSQPPASDSPRRRLRASLHHLMLGSPEPAQLADFYIRALGYAAEPCGDVILARGADRRLGFTPGPARTLQEAGYALEDASEMDRLKFRLQAGGVSWEEDATAFFSEAVSVIDPDGARISFGLGTTEPAPSQDDAVRIARLQHVVRASRQPERVARFITEALGFSLSDNVVDAEGGVRTAFMRCSREHHSFAVFKAAEDRLDHHCYEVADWNAVRDWCDHFSAERIPLQWGPGRHGPGNNLFVFVHDPDGNWVELSAELEIVDHERPVGVWPHEERTFNSWGQGLLRS